MEKIKKILKVVVVYALCMLFLYTFILKIGNTDNNEEKVLQEYNYEEYYVFENK